MISRIIPGAPNGDYMVQVVERVHGKWERVAGRAWMQSEGDFGRGTITPAQWKSSGPAIDFPAIEFAGSLVPTVRMEETYPGGYIIPAASDATLLAKHILFELYQRAQPFGLGEMVDSAIQDKGGRTVDEVWEHFAGKKEGAKIWSERWLAGVETKRVLGMPILRRNVYAKVKTMAADYVFGRRMKCSFSVDEFGNIYLPREFNGATMREVALAAIDAARWESPTLTMDGVHNRMPPAIEANVNRVFIQLAMMRRDDARSSTRTAITKPGPTMPPLKQASDRQKGRTR